MELDGLPLIPTAEGNSTKFETGGAKSYKAERGKGQVYTCGALEYNLLLDSQAPFLVDRSIPEDLYALMAGIELQESCNVKTLSPQTLVRLFDMGHGTLPAAWKGSAEVQWTGSSANEPSQEWVQLFWEYAAECAADLECFEDWPLLPCNGGVLRRLIKESSVVDMGSAPPELCEVLVKLGCRGLDTKTVAIQPKVLAEYVHPCTGEGVIKAVRAAGVLKKSAVFEALTVEMKRTFRAFIGREHANGWRPEDAQLDVLRALPVYEAYCATKGDEAKIVNLMEQRWIPPQGASRELMDSRCLKLVQAEDASLYQCLKIPEPSEPLFFSEFVFPLRLKQMDTSQQDSTMLGILRALPRFVKADPQFKTKLSEVEFISTACGARRRPTDVYHPDLQEIVAELLGADEHLPTGAFAEPDILEACIELGLRRSVDRTTLLESAKSVAFLSPALALVRAKTLVSYLDTNFQALVKNSVGADTFQKELQQLCWLPALVTPTTDCMPWPTEEARNIVAPTDIRPQTDAWVCSASMRLLDHKIQSLELLQFLGLGEPVPIGVLAEQIIQLSAMASKLPAWRNYTSNPDHRLLHGHHL